MDKTGPAMAIAFDTTLVLADDRPSEGSRYTLIIIMVVVVVVVAVAVAQRLLATTLF